MMWSALNGLFKFFGANPVFITGETMHFRFGKWIETDRCQSKHDKRSLVRVTWPIFKFWGQVQVTDFLGRLLRVDLIVDLITCV